MSRSEVGGILANDFCTGPFNTLIGGGDDSVLGSGGGDPVSVRYAGVGTATVIRVNGIPVVVVAGGQGMTRADIAVRS